MSSERRRGLQRHHRTTTTTRLPSQDDRIKRAEYLQRCWPGHQRIASFDLLDVCADDDSALIRYREDVPGEPGFQCVEHFEFTDDLVSHVEVYFGRALTPD
jgi:hypothetical protein